ncbi:probable complex I intermediate-associated protein 30 [Olea europaea var. sylvestris]|uniref:probable complex I intermediate-associated protein 30 n=1 Tax=Olea europaea var. sylvestris TaxID=158386 RepID=UPI000C1D576F|nr:probable complex I intermediate-associated protein 30 [Olea europaea var. sylvestris]
MWETGMQNSLICKRCPFLSFWLLLLHRFLFIFSDNNTVIGCCYSFYFHCRFRALLQASLNATKRALVWNAENLVPPSEKYIFNFNSKEELKRWHLYSDSEYGGLSSASLEIKESGNGSSGTGLFSGNLSLDVSESSRWNITRSGFCGMRSKKFDGFIDLDGYDALALKLKGNGRCYISTIYTENWVNLHHC